MNWFQNIATRAKLLVGFGLMFVLMVVIICSAYQSLRAMAQSQKELFENEFLPSLDLVEFRSDQNRNRAELLAMTMSQDHADQKTHEQDIRENSQHMDQLLLKLESRTESADFQRKLAELQKTREEYGRIRSKQFDLIYADKPDAAKQLGTSEQEERYNRIRALSMELGQEKITRAQQRLQDAERKFQASLTIFIAAGIVALLLSAALTLLLNRVIANPLKEITDIAELVATGDMNICVPEGDRKDEVGLLTQSFRRMVENIGQNALDTTHIATGDLSIEVQPQSERDVMGNALATMVKGLREMTKEIIEGVNVLASSASEIMASSTQVTSGTSETAAAVNQTTCTLEEVKQTALVSSQKARNVSDISQNAVQVAQEGTKAVTESINGINRIQEQVEAIAESIVSLSEQSQAIGEIINTVNDLAEQSNLLSVNAAIEAAKAGEHGKGFTVVAQEVKNLAEQSKTATAQVRTILNDIQKATNAAVMATEQGNKAVETGVRQSREAGQAIQLMSDSIGESAQAAQQIAASSQQQLVGMDQITQAMENIKQASEQNVAGMRQVEATAQGLHNLGKKLKDLVERYRI